MIEVRKVKGSKITKLRGNRSYREISKLSDNAFSAAALHKWEHDRAQPTLATLPHLLKALGCTYEEVTETVKLAAVDRPLWEKHKEQERQALIAALAERDRLDPDAPNAIVIKDAQDDSQLRNTQNALRNLYRAVQKSRAVNDPLGMATAMEEAGKWF